MTRLSILALLALPLTSTAIAQDVTTVALPSTDAEVMIFEKAQALTAAGRGKTCDEALTDAVAKVDKKAARLDLGNVISYVDEQQAPTEAASCEIKGKKAVIRLDAVGAELGSAEPFVTVSKERAVAMVNTLAGREHVPVKTSTDIRMQDLVGRSDKATLSVVEVSPRGQELVVLLDKDFNEEAYGYGKDANSRGVDLMRTFVTKRASAYHMTMADLPELSAAAVEIGATRWADEPEPVLETWRFELETDALAAFAGGDITAQGLLDASRVYRGSELIELSVAHAD